MALLRKSALATAAIAGFLAVSAFSVSNANAFVLPVPLPVSCAAFSGSFSNAGTTGSQSANLVAGDVVTMTLTGTINGSLYSAALGTTVLNFTTGTQSYTVTSASAGNFQQGASARGTYSQTWSCAHPTGTKPTNQTSAAQSQGQNSQSAMNDMLDGVIDGSLGSSFQGFSGGPNGVGVMVAPGQRVHPTADAPRAMESDTPWRMWMTERYTHASGTETGDQFNGLFGLSRHLGENQAAGLFGGYETFNYLDATPSQLSGNGLSLGGFVAGTFAERLKLDARVYTTFMNYNIATRATTGAFTA